MKLYDPRTWFRREGKASAAGYVVSTVGAGSPVWTPRDYEGFADEAYVRNAIAFRCMAMVAQSVASIPFIGFDESDKEVPSHPTLELLAKPAPGYTQTWIIEALATYWQLAGNAYLESVGPSRRNAPPRELWALRPDRMKVIAGENGLPSAYRYEAGGRQKDWQVDKVTGFCEVLHMRRFHPINDWYGMSLVEPAAYSVDRHNEAGKHNMSVLQNGATPSGMLVYKPVKGEGGAEVSAPKEIIEAAEKRLMERYAGAANAGRPMVGNGNVDWVSFGMTMEQLQLSESKLDAARDICAAFGVPIELMLPGQSTYNNRREAKLSLYEETVLPLFENIAEHLNNWLVPRFDRPIRLAPNLDEIEALATRREARQKQTTELWEAEIISRDEAREAMQFEAQPDMPQRKVNGQTLSALVNAAKDEPAMYEPLFNYLKSVGLVSQAMDFADWFVGVGGDQTSLDEIADAVMTSGNPGTKAAKKTLYVHRPLLNAGEVIEWAKANGFEKTLPASEMHVTIAYSKRAFDWSKVEPDTEPLIVAASKNRSVEPLGDQGAVVLLFNSKRLRDRWDALRAAGASWDYPGFKPHVSITYASGSVDLDKLIPFDGQLKFGPEVFAEIDAGALERIRSTEKGVII